MISTEDISKARRSIWRHRGRRFATGLNVLISIALATLILGMMNYLSYHHFTRWDLGLSDYFKLSGKTIGLLNALDAQVDVTVFFEKNHELFDDVRSVLKEYEYEAEQARKLRFRVEFIDPNRDLGRVRELKQKYDLKDTNLIVFESAGRRKYVSDKDIMDYDYSLTGRQVVKKATGFKAEQVISSAIQSVTQSSWPVVYFLSGHGEHDIDDSKTLGYSSIARLMRRDNMEVKSLLPGEKSVIPRDCSALVVAGAGKQFSEAEVELLEKYLERNGRILLLVDPGTTTGLEKLLAAWGVKVCPDAAVGMTLTGRELIVSQYGDHPMTRNLTRIVTMFNRPRVLEPMTPAVGAGDGQSDKPRVSVLASNEPPGWAESDLKQDPPRFDPEVDRPAPVPVALAVEKGQVGGIDVEIRPTRLVVVGDSYFVSNAELMRGAGGNVDFFMSAMNWLVERESLMGIAPKAPWELRLDMSQMQMRLAFLIMVVAIPGSVALVGVVVWLRRRR